MATKTKGPKPMDPKEREHLEECLANLKTFLTVWQTFYFLFRQAFLGEPVTVDLENRFLKLKSEVARKHQFLYEQLGQLYIGGALITDLLRMVVNLEKISKTQSSNFYKIERFWHEFYLNLYDTLTTIQFRLEQEDKQE